MQAVLKAIRVSFTHTHRPNFAYKSAGTFRKKLTLQFWLIWLPKVAQFFRKYRFVNTKKYLESTDLIQCAFSM